MGGKRNAVTNLTNRLVDQRQSALAMAALVGRCLLELMARVLQQVERGVHVRLLGQGVPDAHACRDGERDEQSLARY